MKRSIVLISLIAITISAGCAARLGIARHPAPITMDRGKLTVLPTYDPSKVGMPDQMDLRMYDLSELDLKGHEKDLMFAMFDSRTRWPESVKSLTGFSPEKLMELGKNPGLGLRALHAKGVTGKGVSIAIIDQPMLVDHVEYKDRLKMYEEIGCGDNRSEMHGPAVASIAVGKTVGVAPGADLYYIATYAFDINTPPSDDRDFANYAKAVDRVLAVNKTLPKQNKIRVIAMSIGWSPKEKDYEAMVAAVERAKKQGIFVISTSLYETYKAERMLALGLGREPLADPDKPASYRPGLFWEGQYANVYAKNPENPFFGMKSALLVPMDSRCTAGPTGNEDYAFYRTGGLSWSVPYVAGLYALACQVKPDITPVQFWDAALATGDTIEFERAGKTYKLGKIANPAKLIEKVKS